MKHMYIKDRPDLGSEHFPVYEIGMQEVQPDSIKKLIEAYQGGFLTAMELADLILQTLPQPEAERVTATIEAAHQRALREQPKPEEDDDGLPLPATKHDEGCQCHLCWVASLTPPSPPWKAPENQPPAGVAQWEWELGKTDPAQNICGYCGAPYYPGNAVYCASCTPRKGGAA